MRNINLCFLVLFAMAFGLQQPLSASNYKNRSKIPNIETKLTTGLITPDLTNFLANGGLEAYNVPFISDDGKEVFVGFVGYQQVNVVQAQLFANNNGNLSQVAVLPEDGYFGANAETAIVGASPDFSLFSVVDDGEAEQIRIRIYANQGTNTFSSSSLLVTGYLNDLLLGLSGTEDDAYFTPDNKYMWLSYSSSESSTQYILRVLDVSTLEVVASIETPFLQYGNCEPIQIGSKSYLTIAYSGGEGTNSGPNGFNIYAFDESNLSLTLVAASPPMYATTKALDVALIKNESVIRVGVVLTTFDSLQNGVPFGATPIIPSPFPEYKDTHNLQVFDFHPTSEKLTQVRHAYLNGGGMGFANWLPSSNGTILAFATTLNTNINVNGTPIMKGDVYSLNWIHIDKNSKVTYLGEPQFFGGGPAFYYQTFTAMCKNSKWLVVGPTMTTPLSSQSYPPIGFPTIGTDGVSGYSNLLLYKISTTCKKNIDSTN